MSRAKQIVQAIIDDLTDRKGLRHAWDNLDEDIQQEIAETWEAIVDGTAPGSPALTIDERAHGDDGS